MCLFCKIVNHEIPAKILFETDDVVAFADVQPVAPTHALVVPRRHIASLDEAKAEDEALLGKLVLAGAKVAGDAGLKEGWRLVVNSGPAAGQSVFHVHVHVLGGRKMAWPPG